MSLCVTKLAREFGSSKNLVELVEALKHLLRPKVLVVVEAPGDEHVDKVGKGAQRGVQAHGFLVEFAAVGHAGNAADLVVRGLLVALLRVVVAAQEKAFENNNTRKKAKKKPFGKTTTPRAHTGRGTRGPCSSRRSPSSACVSQNKKH